MEIQRPQTPDPGDEPNGDDLTPERPSEDISSEPPSEDIAPELPSEEATVDLNNEPPIEEATADLTHEPPGEGIAPDEQTKVFEPFYRGDAARTTNGSGLGLAICRAIVEQHGGRIWIVPSDAGTRVRFTLPRG